MVQVDVRRYQITCNSVHVALHSAVALPRTPCGGTSVALVFPAGLETQLYLFQLSVKKLFLKRVKDEQWNVQKTSKAYVFFVTLRTSDVKATTRRDGRIFSGKKSCHYHVKLFNRVF